MPIDFSVATPYLGKPLFALRSAFDTSVEEKLRGKEPLVNQWQFTPKCDNLSRFANNEVGYAIEDDILVLDVDVRNGKQGNASLIKMSQDHNFDYLKNATVAVITGSGGYHLYYKKPNDIKIRKKLAQYPDIDFLGKGCYVVTAGSNYHTGSRYQWLNRVPQSIAEAMDAPTSLITLLEKQSFDNDEVATHIEVTDATIGFAVQVAQAAEPAVQGANGDDHTFKTICHLRDTGIDADTTLSILLEHWNPRCSPPWQPEELRVKVSNAYTYAHNKNPSLSTLPAIYSESTVEGFEKDPNEIGIHNWTDFVEHTRTFQGPKLVKSVENCRLFLEFSQYCHGVWAYDEFEAAPIITNHKPWMGDMNVPLTGLKIDDAIVHKLRYYLITNMGADFPKTCLDDTIEMLCHRYTFHPVRTYLTNLRWDGKDRCSTWLNRYCAIRDDTYSRAVGVRWLVGAVQRVCDPGSQMDSMLIFYGSQGLGKSSAANILAGDWFLNNLKSLGGFGKDAEEGLRGKWIVEVAELEGFNKVDMGKIKEFVTRRTDTYRPSYGRRSMDFKRQCVFLGTTNLSHFLRDDENRRFWAVKCEGEFDLPGLARDRDQLWAQAYHLYKSGHPSYLETKELQSVAHEVSKIYTVSDPWRTTIREYLDGKNFENKRYDRVDPLHLFVNAIGGTTRDANVFEIQKVQSALKFIGWVETSPDVWERG